MRVTENQIIDQFEHLISGNALIEYYIITSLTEKSFEQKQYFTIKIDREMLKLSLISPTKSVTFTWDFLTGITTADGALCDKSTETHYLKILQNIGSKIDSAAISIFEKHKDQSTQVELSEEDKEKVAKILDRQITHQLHIHQLSPEELEKIAAAGIAIGVGSHVINISQKNTTGQKQNVVELLKKSGNEDANKLVASTTKRTGWQNFLRAITPKYFAQRAIDRAIKKGKIDDIFNKVITYTKTIGIQQDNGDFHVGPTFILTADKTTLKITLDRDNQVTLFTQGAKTHSMAEITTTSQTKIEDSLSKSRVKALIDNKITPLIQYIGNKSEAQALKNQLAEATSETRPTLTDRKSKFETESKQLLAQLTGKPIPENTVKFDDEYNVETAHEIEKETVNTIYKTVLANINDIAASGTPRDLAELIGFFQKFPPQGDDGLKVASALIEVDNDTCIGYAAAILGDIGAKPEHFDSVLSIINTQLDTNSDNVHENLTLTLRNLLTSPNVSSQNKNRLLNSLKKGLTHPNSNTQDIFKEAAQSLPERMIFQEQDGEPVSQPTLIRDLLTMIHFFQDNNIAFNAKLAVPENLDNPTHEDIQDLIQSLQNIYTAPHIQAYKKELSIFIDTEEKLQNRNREIDKQNEEVTQKYEKLFSQLTTDVLKALEQQK